MNADPCPVCSCVTLSSDTLRAELDQRAGDPTFFATLVAERPHLFADVTVFISTEVASQMRAVVAAVEAAATRPGYIERALSRASASARVDFGTAGAFMGYDFHLSGDTPRLIEVNTNAGGAYLAAAGASAHRACCGGEAPGNTSFETAVTAMFIAEWRRQRGDGRPTHVAIVDTDPEGQYLYPEFVLAKKGLESSGITATIADPSAFTLIDGALVLAGQPVDLVYNRLTDFALEQPGHAVLREAYLTGAAVFTPGPRQHALFADKRNLVELTAADFTASLGLEQAHLDALATIPRTRLLTPDNADALYAERKNLFFKPVAGHGGKGVYRGDKLTQSVWARIVEEDYVAQALVRPSERQLLIDGELVRRKVDVRLYTYDNAVLLVAARVYQGQTTNFRTPGGGFAPVVFIAEPFVSLANCDI